MPGIYSQRKKTDFIKLSGFIKSPSNTWPNTFKENLSNLSLIPESIWQTSTAYLAARVSSTWRAVGGAEVGKSQPPPSGSLHCKGDRKKSSSVCSARKKAEQEAGKPPGGRLLAGSPEGELQEEGSDRAMKHRDWKTQKGGWVGGRRSSQTQGTRRAERAGGDQYTPQGRALWRSLFPVASLGPGTVM